MLNDLHKPKFLSETLRFSDTAELNLDQLTMSGHSFGGMTAIQVAKDDDRCKNLFAIDPWLWIIHEKISDGSFTLNIP
jgi:alpha/beta superfamily hydrolase